MTLVADGDVPDPVIRALQAVQYDIVRPQELGVPLRPDTSLMAGLRPGEHVLVTRDTGIPSQAYLFEFGQRGLTVVVLRWKRQLPKDWQKRVMAVLRDGESWERMAARAPSVISVNRRGSRPRGWSSLPSTAGDPARGATPATGDQS